MIAPQLRLNRARIRQERRMALAHLAAKLALAAALALVVWAVADATLTTALALSDLLDQAAHLKGM